jgi:GNAT superfamily N-acetyltransferase
LPGADATFVIRSIQEGDIVKKFEIERVNDGLRAFLKKTAHQFHSSNIAKTYVAVEADGDGGPKRIRSYISILLSEIRKDYARADDCPEAARYNFPAIKIARLATERDYEGRGLGSGLIDFVAGLAKAQIMPHAGCRFLILDANREKIDFYQRRGFVLVDNEENIRADNPNPVMFMDLHKIAAG